MEIQKIALVNGHIYAGEDPVWGRALLMAAGRIVDICSDDAVPGAYQVIDVQGANICPGLIDLQIYGTGTDLFSAGPTAAALQRIERNLLGQGCTSFMLTLATNALDVFKKAIHVFRQSIPQVALGLHLEGPFLNAAKRGAHPAAHILLPEIATLEDLLADSDGVVKMMTVAPELWAQEAIQVLLEKGILVSAGHSAASFAEANQGFVNGIRAVTHLWNAMSPLHHREVGLPGATFRSELAQASIIADGIHVDYETLKISKQLLGERLFLITDAVAACDTDIYQHVYKGDHYTLPDGTLSGSALTMLQAIKNCVEHAGIPLVEAIRMATAYPARLIGRQDIGKLQGDALANVLVFDNEFRVQQVYFQAARVT